MDLPSCTVLSRCHILHLLNYETAVGSSIDINRLSQRADTLFHLGLAANEAAADIAGGIIVFSEGTAPCVAVAVIVCARHIDAFGTAVAIMTGAVGNLNIKVFGFHTIILLFDSVGSVHGNSR